ncbi:hypothetical protein [Thermanaerothrix sp.]|jgi:hypothetical protein|uniref:hypothetical protein n=1 Tax=Thermanaerothrix sp. TaxID=2972675 RepID=UPI002ADDE305|nr:hypothetical protein [Thermanaerothrix sp.]
MVSNDLCYTDDMAHETYPWVGWAKHLQRWGIAPLVAALLEGTRPLQALFVQVLQGSQPLLTTSPHTPQWQALIHVLEDEEAYRTFIHLLTEETQP